MKEVEPTLSSVLDFGQGDDDTVNDIMQAFFRMYNGFYDLTCHSDDWWTFLNQDAYAEDQIKAAWNEVNIDDLTDMLNHVANVLVGCYIRKEAFASALDRLSEIGAGFRPRRDTLEGSDGSSLTRKLKDG